MKALGNFLDKLENMNNISGGGSFKGGVGKKSILKKGSMAVPTKSKVSAIHTQAQSSWGKSNNKKSVCFKTNWETMLLNDIRITNY